MFQTKENGIYLKALSDSKTYLHPNTLDKIWVKCSRNKYTIRKERSGKI